MQARTRSLYIAWRGAYLVLNTLRTDMTRMMFSITESTFLFDNRKKI